MFNQFFLNSIISGSVYSLIAIGFTLIYSTTRFFHFALAAIFTLCPYLTYLFFKTLDSPFYIAVPIALIFSGLLGISIELVVYKPMRQQDATSLVLLLSSFGVYIILQNVISMGFGDDMKTLQPWPVNEGFFVFGARITQIQISSIVISFCFVVVTWCLMKLTQLGKEMRAIASDPNLAIVTGINVDQTILFSFIFGSILAGNSGLLTSLDIGMTPTMGMNALMIGVVAAIIGGIGNIYGAVLGSFLIAFAQNFGVWKIPSQWQDAIAFIILLFFLLFRPYGFFGKKITKVEI
jgi:branched-chain amino acid transport system permease protein